MAPLGSCRRVPGLQPLEVLQQVLEGGGPSLLLVELQPYGQPAHAVLIDRVRRLRAHAGAGPARGVREHLLDASEEHDQAAVEATRAEEPAELRGAGAVELVQRLGQ